MVINFEGERLAIYVDVAGYETIGVGHKLTEQEKASGVFANGISKEQSRALLRADAATAMRAVNEYVKVPLEQHQFDVLMDFTINEGTEALRTSMLVVLLNQGDYASVPMQLERWMKRKDPKTGQLVADAGLLKRRQAEGKVWMDGYGGKAADEALRQAANVAVAHAFSTQELLDGAKDPDENA